MERYDRQLAVDAAQPSAGRRMPGPRMTSNWGTVESRAQAVAHKRPSCHCGKCSMCIDEARWERIFAEKFADPSYYSGLVVRHSSSLNYK